MVLYIQHYIPKYSMYHKIISVMNPDLDRFSFVLFWTHEIIVCLLELTRPGATN